MVSDYSVSVTKCKTVTKLRNKAKTNLLSFLKKRNSNDKNDHSIFFFKFL